MNGMITGVVLFLLTLSGVIILAVRLRFSPENNIFGRTPFWIGTVLILLSEFWQIVKNTEAYSGWFLDSAYRFLDLTQTTLLLAGLILVVTGLVFYADSWQVRRDDLDIRQQRLSLLNNIQRDSRQPYQLLELLNLALKEVVSTVPETSGVIFLVNRSRRQFVLTASVGLTKRETAALEYYPMERNVISQAVDLGEPIIAGEFKMVSRTSETIGESRFKSFIVLPMISGTERVGCIVLFSEKQRYFSQNDINCLAPTSEWIAEKIITTRLKRELSLKANEVDRQTSDKTELVARVTAALNSHLSDEPETDFCRRLVGFLDAQSVHLVGLVNGSLRFFAGSEPLDDLSENFRTALIEGLDKNKPLILNQEATGEDGRAYTLASTLISSFPLKGNQYALMFRKDSSTFKISESELKAVDIFSRLSAMLLTVIESNRLNLSRRKGFSKILQLLRLDSEETGETTPESFAEMMKSALPGRTKALALTRDSQNHLRATAAFGIGNDEIPAVEIYPGEGELGLLKPLSPASFAYGRLKIEVKLRSLEPVNHDRFYDLFGESGLPSFMAACPLYGQENLLGVAIFFVDNISESEANEWERILTLATTLFSFRATINELRRATPTIETEKNKISDRERTDLNQLNNHLSVILGNAELGSTRPDIDTDTRAFFLSIVNEAEAAATSLKKSTTDINSTPEAKEIPRLDLNRILTDVLKRSRISENLYLIDGRTREINVKASKAEGLTASSGSVTSLISEVIEHFSTLTNETDIISISTYADDKYAYLDISRHLKNFPPVEKVKGFGQYQPPEQVLNYRPSDSYLKYLSEEGSGYSFDRHSPSPSYLSFKFPLKSTHSAEIIKSDKKRILAIDDQSVILDLITAMCQSQGYLVDTALSGEEGLELISKIPYDLVLTDLAMPGISGLEVSRSIKRRYSDIPVILVTGWEVNVSQAQLDEAGISAVLYKPFRIEQLVELIASASVS